MASTSVAPLATLVEEILANATAAAEADEWNGDEFSNNLFSDLAPLLTLFGEQVTKQFLTMSMGWADNVLVSVGPLGIITVVISAIRVGGVRRLKALIGRARESQATAEQELLSSTSDNVCELWSGDEIIRQLGKPDIKELIIVRDENCGIQVLDLQGAVLKGWLQENNSGHRFNTKDPGFADNLRDLANQAPNIALNIESSTSTKTELWSWAILGVILQLVALVIPALATYYYQWPKASQPIQRYAYPCFVIGTVVVCLGVLLCSHVIEGVTLERTFEPVPERSKEILQVLRLQRACSVGDQNFQAFVLFNQVGNKTIRTSRLQSSNDDGWGKDAQEIEMEEGEGLISKSGKKRSGKHFSNIAAFSSFFAIAGFICQFVGLRGLHWSATIVLLGVTLIMTGARSWVRRGLAANPPHLKLSTEKELVSSALLFASSSDNWDMSKSTARTLEAQMRNQKWEIRTGEYGLWDRYESTGEDGESSINGSIGQRADGHESSPSTSTDIEGNPVSVLMDLHSLMPDRGTTFDLALKLSRAIEQTLEVMDHFRATDCLKMKWQWKWSAIKWTHQILRHVPQTKTSSMSIIELECDHGGHDTVPKAPAELFAVLSLWLYSLEQHDGAYVSPNNEELNMHKKHNYVRILGEDASFGPDLRELRRWLPGPSITSCNWPDGPGEVRLPEYIAKGYKGLPVARWPVFGMSTTITTKTAQWPDTGQPAPEADLRQFPKPPWKYDGTVFEPAYIVATSTLDIPTQCALEIYSGFIHFLAGEMHAIGGLTQILTSDFSTPGKSGHEETWTNDVISAIGKVLVNTGLVDTMEEANLVVVPPFAKGGLLPKEVGSVRVGRAGDGDGVDEDEDEDEVPELVPMEVVDDEDEDDEDDEAPGLV